jgi:hypothetical protein
MRTICFTICLCTGISPDLDGYQGTKNELLTPQDPQQVPKPKYEATALQVSRYDNMFHDMSLYDMCVPDTGIIATIGMFHGMFVY